MSDLVGNLDNRLSRVAAHISMICQAISNWKKQSFIRINEILLNTYVIKSYEQLVLFLVQQNALEKIK